MLINCISLCPVYTNIENVTLLQLMQFKSEHCVDTIDLHKFMPLSNLHTLMAVLPRKMKRSITYLLLHKSLLVKKHCRDQSIKCRPLCPKYLLNILCLKTLLSIIWILIVKPNISLSEHLQGSKNLKTTPIPVFNHRSLSVF